MRHGIRILYNYDMASLDCVFYWCGDIPRDDMNPGLRTHKQSSLRVSVPMSMPEDMRDRMRELIDVHSDNLRKGHATALLHQVCAEADRSGKTLMIHVEPFGNEMTAEQLQKWYGKFGFVVVQDKPCLMARSVQESKIVRAH